MPPEHAPIHRCLSILRRLVRGPADRDTLIAHVCVDYDVSAYGDLTKAELKRFENDIARLRDWGVEIVVQAGNEYYLRGYGTFSPVALREDELDALAFLTETFAPGAPNADAVQQLVQRIADWLPDSQHDSISARRQRWRVDLRRVDTDDIQPALQEAIEQAISQRRLLRFDYRSPGQKDRVARRHTVQPAKIYFDTTRRHLYLDAYWLTSEGPYGPVKQQRWQNFRLGRIAPESIELLPEKFGLIEPKRPRHQLEYWLAPEIARLREISRHFDDLQVHETDTAGWVRVTATTDDLFRATRLLLNYAHNCKLVGGNEARQQMIALIEAMARLYGVIQPSDEPSAKLPT